MASVSSLDKDLSRLRLAKYTAQDSQDVKDWIGGILGETLPAGDLMVVLKDGVVLCKLANRLETSNPKLKFKKSAMPFVQMENISHFLSFVSRSPVSLAAHDVFLTVDLFEQKDPAQVVQCLGAFSRAANKLDPISFPTTLGGLKIPTSTAALSPQHSGGWSPGKRSVSAGSTGGVANAYVQSAAAIGAPTPFGKPTMPPKKPVVSSWSKPTDEKGTAPAWNIAQYGYMGGASQGNQGVSFGSRRQITNQPVVKGPSLDDREKLRKNSTDDAQRIQDASQERRRAEEERSHIEDERREGQKRKEEEERKNIEDEKRRREEQIRTKEEERKRIQNEAVRREEERKRIEDDERRKRIEDDERRIAVMEARRHREQLEEETALEITQKRQKEDEARRVRDAETQRKLDTEKFERERERERIRQLERELAKARERERIYEAEKEERRRQDTERMRRDAQEAVIRKHKTGDTTYGQRTDDRDPFYIRSHKTGDRERENMEAERRFLAGAWRADITTPPSTTNSTPLFPQHTPGTPPPHPPRALPTPPPRKLPPVPTTPNRVGALPSSRYFAQEHLASEPMGRSGSWETNDDGAAVALERERAEKREAEKRQAYKWASMSLLERERERERERQREWEANQREMEERREREGAGDDGPAWDVNQYGYMGGADQGKMGVSFGGRRQIIGPRDVPKKW
ncbi:uncharacterized protein LAJ45_08060 [Morchella importuna]|uniref:uncharacterized protein n=1 Tax=Morchella importuna TaxID=1174673 RepID=UPI001E8DC05E|nr:uncharacterized protein LAJ45_08060 [Morchella importuna]KAH8147959.1 hypothetical protein LAJ45_08060 [Morchella importuna]